MPHKGEILEGVVNKKQPNKAELARLLKVDRSTIYRHFSDPDLDDGIIMKYAKVLKYDFSKEFPELGIFGNTLQEPLGEYRPITLSDALKEIDFWRAKYIALLEKHTELLQETYQKK